MFDHIKISLVVPPRRIDAFNNVLVRKLKTHIKAAQAIDQQVDRIDPEVRDDLLWEMYDDSNLADWLPAGNPLVMGLKMQISDLNEKASRWIDARTQQYGGAADRRRAEEAYLLTLTETVKALSGNKSIWGYDELQRFAKIVKKLKLGPDADDAKRDYKSSDVAGAMALLQLVSIRDDVVNVLDEAIKRVSKLSDREYQSPREGELPSSTQKIEKLYHASVNAVSLFRTGFYKSVPDEGGLGGSQSAGGGKKGTSFTYDLRVALAVSRGLKEVIPIANGRIKLKDIKEWARRDGLLDEVYEDYRLSRRKDAEPKNDPMGAFVFYKSYKKTRDFMRAHHDPLFFGDLQGILKSLKGKNPKNVGVLVADVDMNHPDIYFVSGREREIRVPPEAIIRITKLIR